MHACIDCLQICLPRGDALSVFVFFLLRHYAAEQNEQQHMRQMPLLLLLLLLLLPLEAHLATVLAATKLLC